MASERACPGVGEDFKNINGNEEIGSDNLLPRQQGQDFLLPFSFRNCSEGSAFRTRDLIQAIQLLVFIRNPINVNVRECFPGRNCTDAMLANT